MCVVWLLSSSIPFLHHIQTRYVAFTRSTETHWIIYLSFLKNPRFKVQHCAPKRQGNHARNPCYGNKTTVLFFWLGTICLMRVLDSITVEEAWNGRRPCIVHTRVFGCVAYAMVLDEKMGKLNAKGIKCFFLLL